MRFGELGKAVPGLSDRLLSQRLRELEDEGLVEREVEAGTPVRVTYSLTATGRGARPGDPRAEGLGQALEAPTDAPDRRISVSSVARLGSRTVRSLSRSLRP